MNKICINHGYAWTQLVKACRHMILSIFTLVFRLNYPPPKNHHLFLSKNNSRKCDFIITKLNETRKGGKKDERETSGGLWCLEVIIEL